MIELIDTLANRVAVLAEHWHKAVRGAFAEALESGDGHTRHAAARLTYELRERRSHHQDILGPYEGGYVRGAIDQLVEGAQKAAGIELGPETRAFLEAHAYDLVDETLLVVRGLLANDEHSAIQRFRKVQLQASLLGAKTGDPRVAFNMAKVGALEKLHLTRLDAIGRRWNTGVLARREVRKSLMTIYNNVFMFCLLQDNVELASIRTSDGEVVFSIGGSTKGAKTYLEVEEELMHPDARYLVSRA